MSGFNGTLQYEVMRETFLPYAAFYRLWRKIMKAEVSSIWDDGVAAYLERLAIWGEEHHQSDPKIRTQIMEVVKAKLEMYIKHFGHSKLLELARNP